MKTAFVSVSFIIMTIVGLVLLSVIIAFAFFVPAQRVESGTASPVTLVKTPPVLPEIAHAKFTLKTIAENGKLAYLGIGGNIDGIVNPDLVVHPRDVVRVILVNGDGMPHDLFLPDFNAKTEYVKKIGEQTEIVFEMSDMQPGSYVYYCTVPGHRKAGQEGKLIVEEN